MGAVRSTTFTHMMYSYLVIEAVEVSELHHLRSSGDASGEQLGVDRRHAHLSLVMALWLALRKGFESGCYNNDSTPAPSQQAFHTMLGAREPTKFA